MKEIRLRKRPRILPGQSYKVATGCGNLYLTVNRDEEGIFEIFAALGKAGGCAIAQNEALTRAISRGLRYGVPVEEYVKQLSGIRCPNPGWDQTFKQILSCADAIAKVLQKELEYGSDAART